MKAGLRAFAARAAVVALVAVGIPAVTGTHGDASANPATKSACTLSQDEQNGGLGASYVYELKAKNLDCGKAKKLVAKFHKCRHENGGRDGKCPSVKGYNCNQKKLDSSPELLQAKAKCKKGRKVFKNTFGESI
jgi:hypothetical protein